GDRSGENIENGFADQHHADDALGALEQFAGALGALVAAADKVFQAIAVERHHAGFGTREKRGENDKREEQEKQKSERSLVQKSGPVALRSGYIRDKARIRQRHHIGSGSGIWLRPDAESIPAPPWCRNRR